MRRNTVKQGTLLEIHPRVCVRPSPTKPSCLLRKKEHYDAQGLQKDLSRSLL
jgi:hypothetical protein